MNVLHVYKRSFPESIGGVENFINTLCKSVSSYGVTNNVLSLAQKPSKNKILLNGYQVYQAKENINIGSTGFSFDAFFKFHTLAKQADIIHHHYPHPFGDILQIFSYIRKPYIVTYHSDIIRQKNLELIYTPFKNYFLKNCHKIIATSPNYYATSQTLKKYANKVQILPIGISEEDYFNYDPKRVEFWREKLGSNFFLFIGANRYYKGLKIALKAIKNTKIELVLAGIMGIDKELIELAKSYSLSNVKFLGEISHEDKCALLQLCFGFVFPSNLRSEAFGISLLEAAFFGKPLISCEIGTGTSFVNKHNETGLVVIPSSPSDLKNAMLKLMDNPNMALNMGKNAKLRARKLFNANKHAKEYIKIYSNIIEKNLNLYI